MNANHIRAGRDRALFLLIGVLLTGTLAGCSGTSSTDNVLPPDVPMIDQLNSSEPPAEAFPDAVGSKKILVANGFESAMVLETPILTQITYGASMNCMIFVYPTGYADVFAADGSIPMATQVDESVVVGARDLEKFLARWSELDAQFGQDYAHGTQAGLEAQLGALITVQLGAITPALVDQNFDTAVC